ncbi:MAG TPA: hypothetical protein VH764_00885 [Gemmatimonadales bacterium]|jgi:hypothetical protein
MRSRACLAALLTLLGCGGNAPYATTLTASSPSPAPDVIQCARDQLKTIQFVQSSIDVESQRLTARKYDETTRRPDVQFRRLIDRLEIEATPAPEGGVTRLEVTPTTFAEYTTQRGPTEVQEKTSTTAQAAAQTLLKKCSQPVDSASVPG